MEDAVEMLNGLSVADIRVALQEAVNIAAHRQGYAAIVITCRSNFDDAQRDCGN
jgi:hypothetical protein